jgi:hypothetical protein
VTSTVRYPRGTRVRVCVGRCNGCSGELLDAAQNNADVVRVRLDGDGTLVRTWMFHLKPEEAADA